MEVEQSTNLAQQSTTQDDSRKYTQHDAQEATLICAAARGRHSRRALHDKPSKGDEVAGKTEEAPGSAPRRGSLLDMMDLLSVAQTKSTAAAELTAAAAKSTAEVSGRPKRAS